MGDNYYPRYPGDYQRDTRELSLAEHGAYALLMDCYYSVEKPLPSAYNTLFRMCNCTSRVERSAVKKVAGLYFPIAGDGRRHNKRCDKEIEKRRKFSQEQSRKAKIRWEDKCHGNATGNATAMPPAMPKDMPGQCPPSPSPSPSKDNKRKDRQNPVTTVKKFILPEWIKPETWSAYEEMRKLKKKPMTYRARELVIIELLKLKAKGHEPNECLNQSIRNGWTDVYPSREKNNGKNQDRGPNTGACKPSTESLAAYDHIQADRTDHPREDLKTPDPQTVQIEKTD